MDSEQQKTMEKEIRKYDSVKSFAKSAEVIEVLKKQLGLDEKTLSLANIWESVIGQLADDAKLEGTKDGTLFIEVTSSAHLQEIALRKKEIINKINQHFGKQKVVKNIRIKIKM